MSHTSRMSPVMGVRARMPKYASAARQPVTPLKIASELSSTRASSLPKRKMQSKQVPAPVMMSIPKITPPKSRAQKLRERVQDRKDNRVALKEGKPEIGAITGFIMQAEELADGKHQEACVAEVAQEFGEFMYYVETLERQRDNFKQSYMSLLKKPNNSLPIFPDRTGKYF
jgi:hypothetical protein